MDGAEPSLTAADHRLRRQLGLRDLILTQILCVVGSSWVGVAGSLGRAQTLTWIAAMLLFYVPMGASVIGLNRAMPLEGGLYVWARQAFGDLGGFLTAWNLWVYGMAVTATILYATPTELAYLIGPSAAWIPENHFASLAVVTITIAAVTIFAVRGLELGKWVHNLGGVAILIVFAALIVLPIWGIAQHRPMAGHWTPLTIALPPQNVRSLALFGQMLFGALCGLEYIAILAGESRQPARTIAQSVWVSSPIICAMFILGTSSVVAFVPRIGIDFIAPIPQTLRIALGNTGLGNVLAVAAIVLLEIRLLGAASYIFAGVTRLPMVAGWDNLVPEWFTRFDRRWRTPANSILCTAGMVFALVVLANLGVHAQEAFQLLTNASLTHYEIAYLVMFAIPLVGTAAVKRSLPCWLRYTSVVGFCSTAFSLLISAYPFVNVASARMYAAKILGATIVSNLIGFCFYRLRTRFVGSGRTDLCTQAKSVG